MATKKVHWFRWLVSILTIVGAVITTVWVVGQVREYNEVSAARAVVWNEVSYPQGNVGMVVPDEVEPFGVVTVTFKEYCNHGVDVRIERWLDFLGPDGTPTAAYGLTPLEFYGSKFPGGCTENLEQPISLPGEIAGRPAGDALVRLRTVTIYEKPEQVIMVPAFSEPFTLLEAK